MQLRREREGCRMELRKQRLKLPEMPSILAEGREVLRGGRGVVVACSAIERMNRCANGSPPTATRRGG